MTSGDLFSFWESDRLYRCQIQGSSAFRPMGPRSLCHCFIFSNFFAIFLRPTAFACIVPIAKQVAVKETFFFGPTQRKACCLWQNSLNKLASPTEPLSYGTECNRPCLNPLLVSKEPR